MRRLTLLAIFRRALQRIPFASLDVNCLHCFEFIGVPTAEFIPAAVVEVRSATPSDARGMASCQDSSSEFAKRFEAGDHCVVGLIDGKIVGYQWFCNRASYREERYRYKVEIPADAIYGYDAFVVPQYRRAKIWTAFHATYLRDLMLRSNRQKILVMIDRENRVSMNTHLQFGYRHYGDVYVIKIGGKSLCVKYAVSATEANARPSVRSVETPRPVQRHDNGSILPCQLRSGPISNSVGNPRGQAKWEQSMF